MGRLKLTDLKKEVNFIPACLPDVYLESFLTCSANEFFGRGT